LMLSEAQKSVSRAGEDSLVGMDVRMTVGVAVWHRMIMTMMPGIVLKGAFLDLGKGTPKLRHRSSLVADDVAERVLRLFVVDKVPSGGEVVQGTQLLRKRLPEEFRYLHWMRDVHVFRMFFSAGGNDSAHDYPASFVTNRRTQKTVDPVCLFLSTSALFTRNEYETMIPAGVSYSKTHLIATLRRREFHERHEGTLGQFPQRALPKSRRDRGETLL
jgi:hypothetical protein